MEHTAFTALDLADTQFIKICYRPGDYAVYFKVVETARPRWTFTREHKATIFAQLLSDKVWAADIVAAQLRNLLIDCWRSRLDK